MCCSPDDDDDYDDDDGDDDDDDDDDDEQVERVRGCATHLLVRHAAVACLGQRLVSCHSLLRLVLLIVIFVFVS